MYCFVAFLSLSEVHTKKVRKVPPGLPSSVSDDMPFFLMSFRWCHCCFKCVSLTENGHRRPCMFEITELALLQKKHEVVEKRHTLPRFVNKSITLLSELSRTPTAVALYCCSLVLGTRRINDLTWLKKDTYWAKSIDLNVFLKWLTAQS